MTGKPRRACRLTLNARASTGVNAPSRPLIATQIDCHREKPKDRPMRDWLLVLAPVILVIYFLVFPSHFDGTLQWLGAIVFNH